MSLLHFELQAAMAERQDALGVSQQRMTQDALWISLENGVEIEVRYPRPAEYTIGWRWGEAELRIDTAPCHPDIAGFPRHLHREDGTVVADPLTRIDAAPWENLQRVIAALNADPLLGESLVPPR